MKSSSKHRIIHHFICIALTIFICSSLIPLRADASITKYSYNKTTLKQNTTVTAKGYVTTYDVLTDTYLKQYYLYRITVPADGVVKFQTASADSGLHLYKTIKTSKDLNKSTALTDMSGHKTYYKVLPKGKYYMYASKGTKFKWSSSKYENPTNFCRSKAAKLAAGKNQLIVFNLGYEYGRWYEVVLPNTKTISITLKALDEYMKGLTDHRFTLHNSKGIIVQCTKLSNTNYKTELLPKGTYYIRVVRDSDDESEYRYYQDRISQLMWE